MSEQPAERLLTPEIQAEYIARVQREGAAFAELLRDASDAGVSHMLILPQLVLVFRQAFGEMPPEMAAQLATIQQTAIPEQT